MHPLPRCILSAQVHLTDVLLQYLSEVTNLCSFNHRKGFVMRSAAEAASVCAEVFSHEHVAAA